MIPPATADALERIQARAADVYRAYQAGGSAEHDDVNLGTRPYENTNDPLSVAAPPDTYFVTHPAGGARVYTRDGSFVLNGNVLQTRDGAAVLGFPSGSARTGVPVPIELPRADVALGRCSDVKIESDGVVSYTRATIDPRTRERSVERVIAGTLALAKFPAGTRPVRISATQLGAPAGIPPHVGTPSDGVFPGVITYARDVGRVDVFDRLGQIIDVIEKIRDSRVGVFFGFSNMRIVHSFH